jgi:hypothetical protein
VVLVGFHIDVGMLNCGGGEVVVKVWCKGLVNCVVVGLVLGPCD